MVVDFDPAERPPQVGRGRPERRELKARIKCMVLAFEADGETLSYQPRSRMVRLVFYGLLKQGEVVAVGEAMERWVVGAERWLLSADGKSWRSGGTDLAQEQVRREGQKKNSDSFASIRELIKGVVEEIKAERAALTHR